MANNRTDASPPLQMPTGWKLVPIDPTTGQLKAMFDTPKDAPWLELYKAAINAAPEMPRCENGCHWHEEYGFVPEAGCPRHD